MLKTILAVIGGAAVVLFVVKQIIMLALRFEHEDDLVSYQIYKGKDVVWESGLVEEFTSKEHTALQNFLKEWAKYPGSTAVWHRLNKKEVKNAEDQKQ